MRISIQYCAAWNYEPQAVSLTDHLVGKFKQQIEELKSEKTFDSTLELSSEIDEIYSKLLSRSEKNNEVKINLSELTKNDLKTIIDELLLDLQKQGMYFKKYGIQNVSLSKNDAFRRRILNLFWFYPFCFFD